MAKENKPKNKYKNVKLEQEELTPKAIGMFENRKKSSVGIFIVMFIFILVVFFLPEISEHVNNYFNPPTVDPGTPTPGNPVEKPTEPTPVNDYFFEYSDDLEIKTEDILVNHFSVDIENNTFSYDITNILEDSQEIESLNYYLEIYNSEETLIERVKLTRELTLTSGAFERIDKKVLALSASTIGYLGLVKKTVNDYPEVILNEASDGKATLVCSNGDEKVTYNFVSSKLKELTSEYSYYNTNEDYEEQYSKDRVSANTYNNKDGITSTFLEHNESYDIITSVDLSSASRMYIFNADTFTLDAEPKVVKFEMETQGFNCE